MPNRRSVRCSTTARPAGRRAAGFAAARLQRPRAARKRSGCSPRRDRHPDDGLRHARDPRQGASSSARPACSTSRSSSDDLDGLIARLLARQYSPAGYTGGPEEARPTGAGLKGDLGHPLVPSPVMPAPTILVVDDEQLIRWSLTDRLTDEGYRVSRPEPRPRRSRSSDEGVDLVLLDYKLPDGDGLTVLKQIKERDPDTLVILLTALLERRDGGRGDEARRLSLRQQAVQPRRDRAARREGARDDAAAARGARAARQRRRSPTASTASSARARR